MLPFCSEWLIHGSLYSFTNEGRPFLKMFPGEIIKISEWFNFRKLINCQVPRLIHHCFIYCVIFISIRISLLLQNQVFVFLEKLKGDSKSNQEKNRWKEHFGGKYRARKHCVYHGRYCNDCKVAQPNEVRGGLTYLTSVLTMLS